MPHVPTPPRLPGWTLSRRSLMLALAGLGLAPRAAAAPDLGAPRLRATLAAFVDVIVPADETPGAAALGVHDAILAAAPGRANYPELVDQGAAWLDAETGGDFAGAAGAAQVRTVEAAFAAAPGTLPRVLAEFLRQDVMRLYYAHPQSWRGMIDGPPQPEGYLDADLPPDAGR